MRLSRRDELVAGLSRVFERAREKRELLAPTATRLASPHERMKRMQLAFVVTRFALDAHGLERAVESPRIVEQWIAGTDRNEERGEGTVRTFLTLEDVQRVREVELAGRWVVKGPEIRFVDAFEDVVDPPR